MRLSPTFLVILASCVAALLAGCSGAQSAGEGTREDVDAALLEQLRLDARLAAEHPFQVIRYNPAADACRCPAFEIRVGDTWWRTRLDPAREALEAVAAVRAEAKSGQAGDGAVWYVVGKLDDDPFVACPNGCFGFELTVVSIGREPPPLPPVEPTD